MTEQERERDVCVHAMIPAIYNKEWEDQLKRFNDWTRIETNSFLNLRQTRPIFVYNRMLWHELFVQIICRRAIHFKSQAFNTSQSIVKNFSKI